jgi:alpha-ribazole phosphatase
MSTVIDFIRLGETQATGRLLGRTDVRLSDAGWQQFKQQTDGHTWTAIVTSPLLRARAPAERLAQERGLTARVDEDWAELDFGVWDGLLLEELQDDPEASLSLDGLYLSPDAPAPPEGESWRALQARVERAFGRLLADSAPPSTLIVTHAGPMRAALSLACNIPFASLWAIRIDPGTRITLRAGRTDADGIWGEIVEIVQPEVLPE